MLNTAPLITIGSSSGAAPTLNQGTIKAGKYFLTSETVFNSSGVGGSIGATADVTVSGSTATIKIFDSDGLRTTMIIVMANPTSMPPVSITPSCSTDPEFGPYVGQNISGGVTYGVSGATGNSISAYTAANNSIRQFTLQ